MVWLFVGVALDDALNAGVGEVVFCGQLHLCDIFALVAPADLFGLSLRELSVWPVTAFGALIAALLRGLPVEVAGVTVIGVAIEVPDLLAGAAGDKTLRDERMEAEGASLAFIGEADGDMSSVIMVEGHDPWAVASFERVDLAKVGDGVALKGGGADAPLFALFHQIIKLIHRVTLVVRGYQ